MYCLWFVEHKVLDWHSPFSASTLILLFRKNIWWFILEDPPCILGMEVVRKIGIYMYLFELKFRYPFSLSRAVSFWVMVGLFDLMNRWIISYAYEIHWFPILDDKLFKVNSICNKVLPVTLPRSLTEIKMESMSPWKSQLPSQLVTIAKYVLEVWNFQLHMLVRWWLFSRLSHREVQSAFDFLIWCWDRKELQ